MFCAWRRFAFSKSHTWSRNQQAPREPTTSIDSPRPVTRRGAVDPGQHSRGHGSKAQAASQPGVSARARISGRNGRTSQSEFCGRPPSFDRVLANSQPHCSHRETSDNNRRAVVESSRRIAPFLHVAFHGLLHGVTRERRRESLREKRREKKRETRREKRRKGAVSLVELLPPDPTASPAARESTRQVPSPRQAPPAP